MTAQIGGEGNAYRRRFVQGRGKWSSRARESQLLLLEAMVTLSMASTCCPDTGLLILDSDLARDCQDYLI